VKRETISTKIEKNVDREFLHKIKVKEIIYQKKLSRKQKLEKEALQQSHLADENVEQIVMKHVAENPFKLKKKKRIIDPSIAIKKNMNKKKAKNNSMRDDDSSNGINSDIGPGDDDEEILSDF
jgi:hypothetical protein